MTEKKCTSTQNFVLGGLIGAAFGSVVALLLAPKSGRELRSDINGQVQSAKEKAYVVKDAAIEKGAELSDYAKIQTDSLKEQTARFTDTVKSKASEVSGAAKKYGIKIKADTEEAIEEVSGKVEDQKDEDIECLINLNVFV